MIRANATETQTKSCPIAFYKIFYQNMRPWATLKVEVREKIVKKIEQNFQSVSTPTAYQIPPSPEWNYLHLCKYKA